jgi:hypothetical protein
MTLGIVESANVELQVAGYFENDQSKRVAENVMELMQVFHNQNHSHISASLVTNLFFKLAQFQPLGPLTGHPAEWDEVETGKLWQNKRAPNVFKDLNSAYDTRASMFEDENGERYTDAKSIRPIQFPYIPRYDIVKISKEEKLGD